MSMKKYFPTFAASTNDLKKNARNILKFSKWFKLSPLANNLQLNQVQELVAKAYGFNSYAAYTAHHKKNPTTSTQFVKARLHEIIDCENAADTLFLKTVHSYLITPAGCFSQVTIYEEPTPLLLYVIENWTGEYEHDLFHALASLNAIGMGVYCTHNDLTEEDTKYVYNSPVGGLVRSLIKYEEYYDLDAQQEKVVFKIKKKKNWVALTLKSIKRPIEIAQPELDLGQLKKNLLVPAIEEMDYSSKLLQKIGMYTQQTKDSFELTDDSIQLDRLYISPSIFVPKERPKDAITNIYLDIQDSISFGIGYENQWGIQYQYRDDSEYHLWLYRSKSGFRFVPINVKTELDFHHEDGLMPQRGDLIEDFIAHTITKTLEKHQYILANIWYDSDAILTEHLELAKWDKVAVDMRLEDEMNYQRYVFTENPTSYAKEQITDDFFKELVRLQSNGASLDEVTAEWSKLKADERFNAAVERQLDRFRDKRQAELYQRYDIKQ